MFSCLVCLSLGALSRGLDVNPLEMAIQSAVTCSEAKDDGLLVSRQLVWPLISSFALEDGLLFIIDNSFDFSVGQMRWEGGGGCAPFPFLFCELIWCIFLFSPGFLPHFDKNKKDFSSSSTPLMKDAGG